MVALAIRIFITAFLAVLFLPAMASAWGPLTHVYLGTEMFYFASLLPAGLYSLLKKYRQDFIYGNLMADTIMAKTYMAEEVHSHSWKTGSIILGAARTGSERAFALGYMAHLAADTVAHGEYTLGASGMEHARLESAVDRSLGSRYWLEALSIRPSVHSRNDRFLEASAPESVIFSHGTNRKVFKGLVALSGLNSSLLARKPSVNLGSASSGVEGLLSRSAERILDVLNNGQQSTVTGLRPMSELKTFPFTRPVSF